MYTYIYILSIMTESCHILCLEILVLIAETVSCCKEIYYNQISQKTTGSHNNNVMPCWEFNLCHMSFICYQMEILHSFYVLYGYNHQTHLLYMKSSNAKASKSHLGQKWASNTEWMLSTHSICSSSTFTSKVLNPSLNTSRSTSTYIET